ncbi:MAG: serine hydrolase domain-containing protein [Bacteroidota bacterium]
MKKYPIFSSVFALLLLLFATACFEDDTPLLPPVEADLESDLAASLRINPNVPGAVALLDWPGHFSWSAATGLSNQQQQVLMLADRQFVVASLTKPMTATIVLQLMEEDHLHLDDPLANWLDPMVLDQLSSLDGEAHGNEITIRQLLQHESGIRDYLNDGELHISAYASDPARHYSLEDRLEYAINLGEAQFVPGSDFAYSNTNYILLGQLIEAVTESSLEEVFNQRLFEPLQMTQSYICPSAEALNHLAAGYYQDLEVSTFSTAFNWCNPAGGVVSTVDDLKKFMRAWSEGTLFQMAATQEVMLSPNVDGYGLGTRIFLDDNQYGRVYGHDGSDPAYFSYMLYAERWDAVLIYFGNRAEVEVNEPSWWINRVLERLANQ